MKKKKKKLKKLLKNFPEIIDTSEKKKTLKKAKKNPDLFKGDAK